jgi:acetyltransferase-like isoleucine patch superfamily enzyme
MSRLRRVLATSEHAVIQCARAVRRRVLTFTLPAPKLIVVPALHVFIGLRAVYYFLFRVLVCEPLFKAYCTRYGRNLRTDVYIHWVQGGGELIFGDDVLVDGKCAFTFAARFVDRPTLEVGDRTGISNRCRFTVGKRISIGNDCMIAAGVWIFDSSGHSTDPASRLADLPPPADEVRPVSIGDNVWIGTNSIIFPGVTIGEGSVVSAGSVVLSDVPANTIVAGNPARRIGTLRPATERPADQPFPENGVLNKSSAPREPAPASVR